MFAIPIIQFVIFTSYILYVYYRFGVLNSISESWYKLQTIKQSYLFTLFCFGIGFLMLFNGSDQSPFYFLSGAGLGFTGAAAAFKSKGAYTDIIHMVGAAFAILFGSIGLWYEFGIYIPFVIILLTGILTYLIKIKNSTWWFEIISFAILIIGVFLSKML